MYERVYDCMNSVTEYLIRDMSIDWMYAMRLRIVEETSFLDKYVFHI